jgi:hypothetical protein
MTRDAKEEKSAVLGGMGPAKIEKKVLEKSKYPKYDSESLENPTRILAETHA